MTKKIQSRKAIKGVLYNYLETLTSRYTDYDGYWIYGLLFEQLDELSINLLSNNNDPNQQALILWFIAEAKKKFFEQMDLARIPREYISDASLKCFKFSADSLGDIDGKPVSGAFFRLLVTTISDLGVEHRRDKDLFVAPHDPAREHRSTRRIQCFPFWKQLRPIEQ